MDDLLKKKISELGAEVTELMMTGIRAVKASASGWKDDEIIAAETAGWMWLDMWYCEVSFDDCFLEEDVKLLSEMAESRGFDLSLEEIHDILCEKENKHISVEEYVSSCIPVSEAEFGRRLPDSPPELYLMHRMYTAENVEIMGNSECFLYISRRTGIELERVKTYFSKNL
ncbi:MAG: hypothetical protein MRZ77_02585 [Clostridiales bacterium]|nr:hypothetical protein [Clostridiales bacterium]